MEIAEGKKCSGAAVALVPIYIDGHGPYPFALDTGASRSLMSSALARELHLPEAGSAGVVVGITGSSQAVNIRVDNWAAGKIPLPPTLIAAIVAPTGTHTRTRQGRPIGLLGSDVLSRYGRIAVDYDRSLLILDPPIR